MDAVSLVVARLSAYIINPTIWLLLAAGFGLFVYGLVEMMWSLNSGKVEQKGKDHMLWGIIGMTIMISVLGILNLLQDTLDQLS